MTGVLAGTVWSVPERLSGAVGVPVSVLVPFLIWTLVWKGLALWRAARAGQTTWFVVLLLVHTGGLLEIAYLLFFAGRDHASPPAVEQPRHPPGSGAAAAGLDPAGTTGRGAHAGQ